MEFDEPIDPTSVNDTNFVVTELDDEGNEVGTVSGVLNVIGNSIEFTPDSDLNAQTFYKYSVGTSITDLAGNALTAGESIRSALAVSFWH